MANLYCTGPVHIYVSIPSLVTGSGSFDPTTYPSAIYYLGTGEQPPQISISPLYSPVANDIAGDQIPFDDQYMGKVANGTVTLTRWNEAVIAAIDNIPTQADGARGVDAATDTGTLMQFEGATFHTWFHFPYASSKQFGLIFGMPAGYHFPACVQQPWTISPGTKAKRRLFVMDAKRAYRPADGKFYLFDHTMTTIPAIPPTVATGLVS